MVLYRFEGVGFTGGWDSVPQTGAHGRDGEEREGVFGDGDGWEDWGCGEECEC